MRFTREARNRGIGPPLALLALVVLLLIPPGFQPSASGQAAPPAFERIVRSLPVAAVSETFRAAEERERRFGPDRFRGPRREVPEPVRPNLRGRILPGLIQQEDLGTLLAPPLAKRGVLSPQPRTPDPTIEFDSLVDTGFLPPDDAIAAGPNHLVCIGNSTIQIRSFAGASLGSVTLGSFFASDPTGFIFDPRVSYDAASQRFMLCSVGVDDGNRISTLDLAVSATTDPTGAWNKYVFNVGRGGPPATQWADFPQLGFDGTAIYVACNMFTFQGFDYSGNRAIIVSKAVAIAGGALNATAVDNLLLPSSVAPNTPAPGLTPVQGVASGQPGMMLSDCIGIGLAYFRVTDPLGQAGGPTIASSFIDATDYETAGSAPQVGSAVRIDAGDERLHHAVYRGGVIWTEHTVSSTGFFGKGQCRFYRVDSSGAGTLLSTLSIVDGTLHFFFPSWVPDTNGNAVAVFQGSSGSTHPAIFHARYDAGLGNFEAPLLTEESATTYTRDRWGDYTDATLDVATGNAIWIQGELTLTSTTWRMRAARIVAMPPVVGQKTISGRVTSGQSGLQNVTVTLTPGGTTTQSDVGGNYAFPGLADGGYTVTPSLSGFTFTPTSRNVTVAGNDVPNQNFAVVGPGKSISGRVAAGQAGLQNVTLTLTPGGATTQSDVGGNYSFPGLADGGYTVTPSLSGFTFTPTSRDVTVAGNDVPNQNFAAVEPAKLVSGRVTRSGAGLAGVVLTLSPSGLNATTNSNGDFTINNVTSGNYTLTPALAGNTFTPVNRQFSVAFSGNITGQDFTAALQTFSISGAVTGGKGSLGGILVKATGAAAGSTTTASNGTYTIAGLKAGSYTVKPTQAGKKFIPASRGLTITNANITGVNFVRKKK